MADAVTDLRRDLKRRGYETRQNDSGHWEVLKGGFPVRLENGQRITFPSTPTKGGMTQTRRSLEKQGLLPKPERGGKRNGKRLNKEQLKAKTAILRKELEEVMKDYDLRQVDIYMYADHYAEQHGIAMPANPQGIVSKLVMGKQESMMNDPYVWLNSAIRAIKAEKGNIPRAEALRARASTQVPAPPPPPGPAPEGQPEPTGVEVEGRSAVVPVRVPSLAIEVMRWIYAETKDDDRIHDLVEELAILELRAKREGE